MNQTISDPLVSVIMPAYNAEPYIGDAIRSVLGQSISDWELIVIDDGSSDRTREIIKDFAEKDTRIHFLVNQENMGVSKTRNRGIQAAKGQYIAFLDSDDVWHREKLRKQIELINSTGAGICYCSYAIIGPDGKRARADYLVPAQVSYRDLLKENCIQCSAMLLRTQLAQQILFNPDYYHEDYILGLDILRSGYTAAGCTEILLDWRLIHNSRSFDKKRSAVNRWRIYRSYLKLSLFHTLFVFGCYTVAGLRKYLRRYRNT